MEKAGPTAEELKKIEAQRLAEEKQQAEIAAKKRTVCDCNLEYCIRGDRFFSR